MLTVFHNRRWDSDYRRVKKAVRDGVIGEPFLVENRTAGSGPAVGFGVPEFRQDWRVTRSMGGRTIYDFGPHWIDQMLDLIPSRVVQVFAEVKHLLLVKSEEGLRVMQVIDAAFESAARGRSVEVEI
jgi:scyllo-inositol 2-dehydrogenase (NADP+)